MAILLAIDPQNDFCLKTGALSVVGADDDMKRLGAFISKYGHRLSKINVTLDSHQTIHIAHPIWWVNADGKHPDPFTPISVDDVKNGVWKAYNPSMQDYSLGYVETLETNGRYGLLIWPPHCIIGTEGACVHKDVMDALLEWEAGFKKVKFVTKGSNPYTEHYSAVLADVQIPSDETTHLNTELIDILAATDEDILIVGEALDFCVANTIRDIAEKFGDDQVKRFVLLTDTTSEVNPTQDGALGKAFIDEMTAKGMRLSATDKYFA